MLLLLACIGQIIVTAAIKPKQVHVALETVFNLEKQNGDLKLINNIQDFISKIKDAITNKPSRRNYKEPIKFTEFLTKLLKTLQTYNDGDLERFFSIFDEEIRKYHYKGCKFHRLLRGDMRQFVAEKLDIIKGKPAREIRDMIEETLELLSNAKYDLNQRELLDYINSLYRKDDGIKMNKLLHQFQQYNKQYNIDLVLLVRGGLRSVLFDHYTNLNTNTQEDFKLKLDEFYEEHRKLDQQHLNYKSKVKSHDSGVSKLDSKDSSISSIESSGRDINDTVEISVEEIDESSDKEYLPLNKKPIEDSMEIIKKIITTTHSNKKHRQLDVLKQNTKKRPKYTFVTLYPEEIEISTKKRRFKVESKPKSKEMVSDTTTTKLVTKKRGRKGTLKRVQTIWPEDLPKKLTNRAKEYLITQNIEINVNQGENTSPTSRFLRKGSTVKYVNDKVNSTTNKVPETKETLVLNEDITDSDSSKPFDEQNDKSELKHLDSKNRNNDTEEMPIDYNSFTKKNIDMSKRRFLKDDFNDTEKSTNKAKYSTKPVNSTLPYREGTTKVNNTITTKLPRENNIISEDKTAKQKSKNNRYKMVNNIKNNQKYSTKDGQFNKITYPTVTRTKPAMSTNSVIRKKMTEEFKVTHTISNEIEEMVSNTLPELKTTVNDKDDINAVAKFLTETQSKQLSKLVTTNQPKQKTVTNLANNAITEDKEYDKIIDKWRRNLDNFYDMATEANNKTNRKSMYTVLGPDVIKSKDNLNQSHKLLASSANLDGKSRIYLNNAFSTITSKHASQVTARKMANTDNKSNMENTIDYTKLSINLKSTKRAETTLKTTLTMAPVRKEINEDVKLDEMNLIDPEINQNKTNAITTLKSRRELNQELQDILGKYGVTLPVVSINRNDFVGTGQGNDRESAIKGKIQADFAKIFGALPKRRANDEAETEFPDPFMDLKDVP